LIAGHGGRIWTKLRAIRLSSNARRDLRDVSPIDSKYQLRPQRLMLFSRRSKFRGNCRIHFCNATQMLSINGTAMQNTLREFHRAARGCPSLTGSWLRPVAKQYRDFATELDR